MLDEQAPSGDPENADSAIFYSISNTQRGLKGIAFGEYLIKMVVQRLALGVVTLAVAGGTVGLGLGWLLIGLGDPTGGFLAVFLLPTRDLAIGGVLVVLLGFAAGAVPALLATRLRIVDALRKV